MLTATFQSTTFEPYIAAVWAAIPSAIPTAITNWGNFPSAGLIFGLISNLPYWLLIYPLEWLMGQIFYAAYGLSGSLGWSVLLLSAVVNTLLLPLYHLGDKIQLREQALQASLQPNLDEFRRSFSGSMLYMVQKTFYRQQGYHPIYALRSSIGFAIQVPFFIAAYHFLSGLELLQGQAWGPIADLGQPDNLLGEVALFDSLGLAAGPSRYGNLLPWLMTGLNLLSSLAYTAQSPYSSSASKRQLWGIAILFLVLLYTSPAALLLYWSFSNLYSLAKNLVSGSRKLGKSYWRQLSGSSHQAALRWLGRLFWLPWLTLLEYFLAALGLFLLARFKTLDSIDKQAQIALYWGTNCWYAFAILQVIWPLIVRIQASRCQSAWKNFGKIFGKLSGKASGIRLSMYLFLYRPLRLFLRRSLTPISMPLVQLLIVLAPHWVLRSSALTKTLSSIEQLVVPALILSLSLVLAISSRLWRCQAYLALRQAAQQSQQSQQFRGRGLLGQLAAASIAALLGLGLFNSSALLFSSPSESPQAIPILLRQLLPSFGLGLLLIFSLLLSFNSSRWHHRDRKPSRACGSSRLGKLGNRIVGQTLPQIAFWGSGVLLLALSNNFLLRYDYGVMTSWVFDQPEKLIIPLTTIWLSVLVLPLLYSLWLLLLRHLQVAVPLCWILAASLWFSSAYYSWHLLQFSRSLHPNDPVSQPIADAQLESVYSYSQAQRNVVIIMLDRFIGPYLGSILELDPAIKAQLEGFVWYKNTLSPGPYTISGLTALLGGHEYSPNHIANLSGSLKEKVNQAYLMLPTLFRQHGYDSTVSDPSWANFDWKGDLEIFRQQGIRTERLKGRYTGRWLQSQQHQKGSIESNGMGGPGDMRLVQPRYAAIMILQAIFRALPAPLAPLIYDNGSWLGSNFSAGRLFSDLANTWATLTLLPQISDAAAVKPQFIFMTNDTPHEPISMGYRSNDTRYPFQPMLKTETPKPSNSPLPANLLAELLGQSHSDYSLRHFYADWATMKELGHYFNWMKQQGVYDNSLIILASDHGRDVRLPKSFTTASAAENSPASGGLGPKESDYAYFMPLLMVKLPNAQGPIQTDITAHSTADVPAFASLALAPEERRNPFTDKILEFQNPDNPRYSYYIGQNPSSQKEDRFSIRKSYRIEGPIWRQDSWSELP